MFARAPAGHFLAMAEAGITEMPGRAGVVAGLRRLLPAFGVGGVLACLAWMALWLAMHL